MTLLKVVLVKEQNPTVDFKVESVEEALLSF